VAIPLLDTKLYVPGRRPGTVTRPRLLALLERGARTKLTVISAPPGFGKSTLLADWLGSPSGVRRSIAWVSLDVGDTDPTSFWAYVVAALEAASPGVGAEARAVLESGGATTDAVVTTLLNALADVPGDTVLVLDDYHVIDTPEIHDGVAFLIDHLPPETHVILATRSDPALPLPRLRARGDLVEIRAADLRFTADETGAYLNGPMGLELTAGDVAALEGRTEGWIAALQLAALSVTGRDDMGAFIADFAGDDRYIVDYLVEEVLERQPDRVRRFLFDTSILDRMTGTLCDAVTGRDGGTATLVALERANLFVIPLDDRRRWYRYHHLFADVLGARLLAEDPQRIPALHGRASRWFEGEGDQAEAIRHALAADDVDRAADLIELAAHDLRLRRQELTLRGWLDALPDSTFEMRPVLAIAHAGALLATGEVRGVEARLAEAERWVAAADGDRELAAAEATGMIVRHTEVIGHLPSAIALYRAALARMQGDTGAAIDAARAAFAAASPDQPLERGGAAGMLALALWSRGDLDDAHAAWFDAVTNLGSAGHLADVLGCSIGLADIRLTQGRLRDARRTYERGRRIAHPPDGAALRGSADMEVGLADLARERNDLPAAAAHLAAGLALGESMGLPQNPYRQRVTAARLRVAEGQLDAAMALLDEAEQCYDGDFFPEVRPIPAMRARVLLAHGRLADARDWARDAGVALDDAPSFLREFEHATLARLLLAEGMRDRAGPAIDSAIALAERLLAAADAGGRNGSAIDILVVLALARHARGDSPAAIAALDRAMSLAAPEGYVRVFLDEGPPMLAVLRSVAGRTDATGYARVLLAAANPAQRPGVARQPLVEPLSERELEVLRLLQSELDGPDIARELSISLNTLRTHTKNVYSKLGVNSRRAAVSRAAELGLLSQGGDQPAI
jgi:ATP/maltotriose-dependent transcriptional regulator MalT